jgi:hypothetical protein
MVDSENVTGNLVKEAIIRYSVINEIKNTQVISDSINPKGVLNLLMKVMVYIERYNIFETGKLLSGEEKKQLAFNIISDIVKKSNVIPEKKQFILDILNNVFDPFVENIIDISKNKVTLNKDPVVSVIPEVPTKEKVDFLLKIKEIVKRLIEIFIKAKTTN